MAFSNTYIIGFVTALCLVCSFFVSGTAVQLRDRIDANKLLDKNRQVVKVAALTEPGEDLTAERVAELLKQVEARLVDRRTGEFIDGDAVAYDPLAAAKDKSLSEPVPAAYKGTQVKRLPNTLKVYVVSTPGQEAIVLPIHGYGLWSILYGFICVKQDSSEVVGITFYDHGETPGLGGEVDNPSWKAQFEHAPLFDASGALLLDVRKAGQVDPSKPYQIDGLSGATITTRGVDQFIELWLGEQGYGPLLKKLKQSGPSRSSGSSGLKAPSEGKD